MLFSPPLMRGSSQWFSAAEPAFTVREDGDVDVSIQWRGFDPLMFVSVGGQVQGSLSGPTVSMTLDIEAKTAVGVIPKESMTNWGGLVRAVFGVTGHTTSRWLTIKDATFDVNRLAPSNIELVTAGIADNGAPIPNGALAGDVAILFGLTVLDLDGNKTITAPSGWPAGALAASNDYIADVRTSSKVLASGDLTGAISFGGSCTHYGYAIVRGGDASSIVVGGNDWSYTGAASLASVGTTDLGVVFAALGQVTPPSQAPTISGWTRWADTTPGYQGAAIWTKQPPNNGELIQFTDAGSATSVNALAVTIGAGVNSGGGASAPSTITNLTAVAGNSEVSLLWTEPAANGATISNYLVEQLNGSTWTQIGAPTSATFTAIGLTNGQSYQFRVRAVNSEGTSAASNIAAATPFEPTTSGGAESYAPDTPNLSTTGATIINPADNMASIVAAAPTGAVFHLTNTSIPYTNVNSVTLKLDQRVICNPGVRIFGNNTGGRCFRAASGAHNVVIANAEIYGFGVPGNQAQNIGAIDCKIDDWNEGTTHKGANWTIWNCTIRDNGNTGIVSGDNWTIAHCTILNHNPQGIGSGFGVGGLFYGNYFRGNGEQGAPGSGVNNGQIKMVFHNVGPWGVTAHDTSRFRQLYTGYGPYAPWQHVYAAPSKLQIVNNTFETAGNRTRAVWFDLDVRDAEVAYNTFDDSINGVFFEGCNGLHAHHNTFNRCGAAWGFNSGLHPSKYFAATAACADSSNNTLWEYNTFNDCVGGCVVIFLGERGRNGADWVSLPNGYALVNEAGEQIRNNFNRILPGQASNVGSADHVIRYNKLNGTSQQMGFVYQTSAINRATEAHIETHEVYGNDYTGSTQETAALFFEDGQPYTLAQWRSVWGRDLPGSGTPLVTVREPGSYQRPDLGTGVMCYNRTDVNNFMAGSGTRAFLANGEYLQGQPKLTMPGKSNKELWAQNLHQASWSYASKADASSGGGNCISMAGANNIGFHGMAVRRGMFYGIAMSGETNYVGLPSHDIDVTFCLIEDMYQSAIKMDNGHESNPISYRSYNLNLSDCIIRNVGLDPGGNIYFCEGIYVGSGTRTDGQNAPDRVTIARNLIQPNNPAGTAGEAIELKIGSTNVSIVDNDIENVQTGEATSGAAIAVWINRLEIDPGLILIESNRIRNVQTIASWSAGNGLMIGTGCTIRNNVITGCVDGGLTFQMTDTTSNGIFQSTEAWRQVILEHNTIVGNGETFGYDAGQGPRPTIVSRGNLFGDLSKTAGPIWTVNADVAANVSQLVSSTLNPSTFIGQADLRPINDDTLVYTGTSGINTDLFNNTRPFDTNKHYGAIEA